MTKAEERKALEKIVKIIAEAGEDSYIARAFEGCVRMAEDNIDNDFWNSPKELLQTARNEAKSERLMADTQRKQVADLKKELGLAKETMKQEADRANKFVELYQKQKDETTKQWNAFREQENRAEALEAEVIKLKAKLFDLMFAEK